MIICNNSQEKYDIKIVKKFYFASFIYLRSFERNLNCKTSFVNFCFLLQGQTKQNRIFVFAVKSIFTSMCEQMNESFAPLPLISVVKNCNLTFNLMHPCYRTQVFNLRGLHLVEQYENNNLNRMFPNFVDD